MKTFIVRFRLSVCFIIICLMSSSCDFENLFDTNTIVLKGAENIGSNTVELIADVTTKNKQLYFGFHVSEKNNLNVRFGGGIDSCHLNATKTIRKKIYLLKPNTEYVYEACLYEKKYDENKKEYWLLISESKKMYFSTYESVFFKLESIKATFNEMFLKIKYTSKEPDTKLKLEYKANNLTVTKYSDVLQTGDTSVVDFTLNNLDPNTIYPLSIRTVDKYNLVIETSFQTYDLIDVDGNYYHSVKIGDQVWMLENLKTTKYNDGTEIPILKDIRDPYDFTMPYFVDYYFNSTMNFYRSLNKETYGYLYDGHTVSSGKLAPLGWHVPTIDDWKKLSEYLGGDVVSGGKMKSTKTFEFADHIDFFYLGNWLTPNFGATNASGFNGLPGGNYVSSLEPHIDGFKSQGREGHWWSSTHKKQTSLNSIMLRYDYEKIFFYSHTVYYFFSVRCIKD